MIEGIYGNSYPGRGIIVGASEDGKNAVVAYFIMGRSVNSRNRILEPTEDAIRTKAFDESKLSDPSLIIYNPVRKTGDTLVVTNGDQTDTVYDYLKSGKTFEEALRTREFEPDGPNFTPRISAALEIGVKPCLKMSILKAADPDGASCARYFWEYDALHSGEGYFIHTYKCDGNPIPSFTGEPEIVKIKGGIDEFTDDLWESLDGDNKVSLFVRYIDIETGAEETKIVNVNK